MKLAITGMGVVSAAGIGRRGVEGALRSPEVTARTAERGPSEILDAELFPESRTAEVRGWDPVPWLGKKGHRNNDRLTRFMLTAAKLGLEDAGIKREGEFVAHSSERVGICSATAYGSLDEIHELQKIIELEEPRYINPQRFPNTVINAASGYVSIREELRAPNTTLVDGNTGALDAFLTAELHLEHDRGDAFLVGGGEVVSNPLQLGLSRLGVLAVREGDEGIVPGEGAAYVVVERPEEALARGARLLGEICGYGNSLDAPNEADELVHASEVATRRSMELALADAGIEAEEVDVVAAATSGNAKFDQAELAAIHALFGGDIAVAAPKEIFGETFGAAGAMSLVAALGWLDGSMVGPMKRGAAPETVCTVVVNTMGFYGNVSTVVLRKAER